MSAQRQTTVTPWLRRDQWDRFCSVYADRHELPASYDEWLHSAQRSFVAFTQAGFDVRRVDVDLDLLISWCRRHRKRLDAKALTYFAMERGLL
jgi:hypothetical protein